MKKPKNKDKNKGHRNLIFIKKGERLNPNGRPKGQKNYATLRREAIIAVGKLNNKTPEEIEIMLHSKGISEALKGDFRFYKDDLDRTHGSAGNNSQTNVQVNISKFDDYK